MILPPLVLEPMYKEKVWGGRRLESLGRLLPGGPDTRIGESWELADLAATAPSGGGGEAARSVVSSGPLAGRTLTDLVVRHRNALLGQVSTTVAGGFPLLLKYLDARTTLSVQVHPSPRYAESHPEAHLKAEAWYIVDAEPGAVLYKGLVPGTTRTELARAVGEGSVPELLVAVPAVAGACHYLPSGICHALGGGVVVAEVQTASDTTFRLYDWERTDRELHVEAALESTLFGPVDATAYEPRTVSEEEFGSVRALVRCPHFAMEEWTSAGTGARVLRIEAPEVWMAVGGVLTIATSDGSFEAVTVPRGRTALLPASLGRVQLTLPEGHVALRVVIP